MFLNGNKSSGVIISAMVYHMLMILIIQNMLSNSSTDVGLFHSGPKSHNTLMGRVTLVVALHVGGT